MNDDPKLLFHIFKVKYLKIRFTENIMNFVNQFSLEKTFSKIFVKKSGFGAITL